MRLSDRRWKCDRKLRRSRMDAISRRQATGEVWRTEYAVVALVMGMGAQQTPLPKWQRLAAQSHAHSEANTQGFKCGLMHGAMELQRWPGWEGLGSSKTTSFAELAMMISTMMCHHQWRRTHWKHETSVAML